MIIIATILMMILLALVYFGAISLAYMVIEEAEKQQNNMKKILKFQTKECSQCKIQDRILEEITDVEIQHINCEDNIDLVDKYKVRTVPTIVVLNGEEVVKVFTGVTKAETIKEVL